MSKSGIFVVGVGMTPLGKMPDRSVKDLTREAVTSALDDNGASVDQIDAAWFANTRQPMLEGQNTVRGQIALRPLGFDGIPIANIENACASGSTALLQSVAYLKAGMADIALIVGAEKMFFPDKRDAMLAAFRGGTDIHQIDATEKKIRALAADVIPNDVEDKAERSFFMDVYAAFARQHMKTFGTTVRQLATVAAKNHHHSTLNPLSQYQMDMSVEDVLNDKPICWPFTRSMCAPISDGAAAALVCTESSLTEFDRSRAIEIRGLSLASGTRREIGDYSNHIGRRAALQAYDQAGITGTDVDVAEVHDATSFAEIQQIENLGLCAQGEGGPFSESGATSLGGQVPVNPSGGLVSKGHPVGATGIAQIFELVTQLRGEAGKRQVAGTCVAVAENGGGFYDVEEAATIVTVLAH
ncbi:MAG: thiolase family protein [Gammaproteobacteria bacterium]|nr:thiolase family protein [Gammaproteobacteria bacterium]